MPRTAVLDRLLAVEEPPGALRSRPGRDCAEEFLELALIQGTLGRCRCCWAASSFVWS